MAKKIFITATGTDVGKTYISALIIKQMREAGFNCGYFKPVLSGVEIKNEKPYKSDCNYVIKYSGIPIEPKDSVSYYWEDAVSPHLAAQRNNQSIDIKKIFSDFEKLNKIFDYILIEGAGGITCPLIIESNKKYLLKDLIKDLDTKIIIIADGGLGTINSTLLTVEYAKSNNIEIKGIILNNFEPDNFMHQDNLLQIETLTDIKVITTITKNQNSMPVLEQYFN